MKFNVVFYYMDGEERAIEIHPDDIKDFMDAIGKSEVYFNDTRGVGMWVAIDKVRWFKVERVDDEGRRIKGGDMELPERDGGDRGGASEVKTPGEGGMGAPVQGDNERQGNNLLNPYAQLEKTDG